MWRRWIAPLLLKTKVILLIGKIKHSSKLSRSIVLLLWNLRSLRHLLVLHSLHQNKRSKTWFVSRITLLLLFKINLKAAEWNTAAHSALSYSLPLSPFLVITCEPSSFSHYHHQNLSLLCLLKTHHSLPPINILR